MNTNHLFVRSAQVIAFFVLMHLGPVKAGQALLDFESVFTPIGAGYSDLGVTFDGTEGIYAQDSLVYNLPSPTQYVTNTTYAATTLTVNVAGGFTGLSLYYSFGSNGPTNLKVYSGVNATGAVLATVPLTRNAISAYDIWTFLSATHTTALSFQISGDAGYVLLDDLRLTGNFKPRALSLPTASNVLRTTATLTTPVNPSGAATSVVFECSPTFNFSSGVVTSSAQNIGAGTSNVTVTQAMTGLSPDTHYYCRAQASNTGGTTVSYVGDFTTTPPSYGVNGSANGTFLDISGTGALAIPGGGLDDAVSDPVEIGFGFNFFGTNYTSLNVTANGLATFGGWTQSWSNSDMRTTGVSPDPDTVAVLWDDWKTAGGVWTQTTGATGQRVFIGQWSVMPLQGADPAMFQMQLIEETGDILLLYHDTTTDVSGADSGATNGGSATVGIRKSGAPLNARFHQWSYNAATVTAGTKLRFSPLRPALNNPAAKPAFTNPRNVTFSAGINPNGWGATASVEYGLTTSYGSSVALPLAPSDGGVVQTATALVAGLIPGAMYHFRVTATNELGTSVTTDRTFFNHASTVTTAIGPGNESGQDVVLQADGKIVVAGTSSNGSNDDIAVTRYNVDGTLDTSFGGLGHVTTGFGSSTDRGSALAIQQDGKIVVSGQAWNGSKYVFAVVRYTSTGSSDASFNGGAASVSFGTGDDVALAVAVQADGKIVLAGFSNNTGGVRHMALARLNTNGTLDTSFGSGGKLTTSYSALDDDALALTIQPDGKLVVAGRSYNGSNWDMTVTRYTTSGALDVTFGSGGKVTTAIGPSHEEAWSLALQADGKIVVAGESYDAAGNADIAVVRYLVNGTLDTAFNGTGKCVVPVGAGADYGYGVALQADGKIVVTGYASNGTNNDIALVRLNSNGTLDSSFNDDGKYLIAIGTSNDEGQGLAVEGDGNLVITGSTFNGSNTDIAIVRYFNQPQPTLSSLDIAVASTGAGLTVTGQVNPVGLNTMVMIEYGSTMALGSSVAVGTLTGSGLIPFSGSLHPGGLAKGTTIYYRVVAINSNGIAMSSVQSFTNPVTYELLTAFTTGPQSPVYASTIRDSSGNLYGTTSLGGTASKGTVFKITPAGTVTTMAEFTGVTGAVKGESPFTDLLLASDGHLYGTTAAGGAGNHGTLFRLTTGGVVTTLVEFTGTIGSNKGVNPSAVIEGADGLLYGATANGGANNQGTIYRVPKSGGNITTLVEFAGRTTAPRGSSPIGKLLLASDGNFYGTTYTGGNNDVAGGGGNGTIYRLTPAGALTTLVEFSGTSGAFLGSRPTGHLSEGSDGLLYGTTSLGGSSDKGTAFKVSKGGTLTSLFSFAGAADGGGEVGSVLLPLPDGFSYGVSYGGGTTNNGTVFRLSSAGVLTTLGRFNGSASGAYAGSRPRALSLQSDGNLYGTTTGAPGTVYRIRFGPTPVTSPAASIAGASARLSGSVNPNGSATTVSFEYGTSPSSLSTTTSAQSIPAGSVVVSVSIPISSGLIPGQTYYYRMRAENGDQFQPQYGEIRSFTTSTIDETTLSPLGVNVGGVNYYSVPHFGNALASGGEWLEFGAGQWGTSVPTWGSAQFDARGFPKYLNSGMKLRGIFWGLHANYSNRPATWPVRDGLANGKILVTWQGDADIRLTGGTFLGAESSGASTGRLINGRRMYRQTAASSYSNITIEDINAASPITDIKVWLPDPANPQNATLEGQRFHPKFLERLADVNWAFIRSMDWGVTNASPLQDWSDRRTTDHVFQTGVLNPRIPAAGFTGNRTTGVAYEHMVALCNAANKDLWICVPHLASDDFVTKLAQLIAFGSDGVNPYTAPQVSPVHAPLNPGLRVWVEYSNEIWSNGNSFPQGNWAQEQATALGISKGRFNGRRFCNVWRLFENVLVGKSRLVRVAAVFTGNQTYSSDFLDEIRLYGQTLVPEQEPDVIAPTTYFGNGIQDWAYQRAQAQAGTSDPWFLTSSSFDSGGGGMRPVSVSAAHAYWTGSAIQGHLGTTFRQWTQLMLSGSTQTGGGPDATGIGGGFDVWLRNLALTTFPTRKPLVTYEGGPSLYSDYLDGGDSRDDGITTFMEALNRQPQMADVYRIHLNMALAKGLRTHGVFTDVGNWGKYGQWGHMESLDQNPANSARWQFLQSWGTEAASLRHIDDVLGTSPQFVTAAKLPTAIWGTQYSTTVSTTGGEGTRAIEVIGGVLGTGLAGAPPAGNADQHRISGSPETTGDNFVYLRTTDADNDPAWRTFYFKTVGGPRVLVESNFEGTNPALNRPWSAYYTKKAGLIYNGWAKGAGITAASGNDALVYSQNMPSVEADSTLALAVTEGEFWTATLQGGAGEPLNLRKAEVRLTMQRIDYHSPRQYAVFTSVGGFTAGSEVFTTPHFTSTVDQEFVFTLPDMLAYQSLTSPVEIRIYGFSGQYAGHKTSLRAFKVTRQATALDQWTETNFSAAQQVAAMVTGVNADPDQDGMVNLLEFALGHDPELPETTQMTGYVSGGLFDFNYSRNKAALNTVSFTVEWSDTLSGVWNTSGVSEEITSEDDTTQQVTAHITFPPHSTARFARLRVSQP